MIDVQIQGGVGVLSNIQKVYNFLKTRPIGPGSTDLNARPKSLIHCHSNFSNRTPSHPPIEKMVFFDHRKKAGGTRRVSFFGAFWTIFDFRSFSPEKPALSPSDFSAKKFGPKSQEPSRKHEYFHKTLGFCPMSDPIYTLLWWLGEHDCVRFRKRNHEKQFALCWFLGFSKKCYLVPTTTPPVT